MFASKVCQFQFRPIASHDKAFSLWFIGSPLPPKPSNTEFQTAVGGIVRLQCPLPDGAERIEWSRENNKPLPVSARLSSRNQILEWDHTFILCVIANQWSSNQLSLVLLTLWLRNHLSLIPQWNTDLNFYENVYQFWFLQFAGNTLHKSISTDKMQQIRHLSFQSWK